MNKILRIALLSGVFAVSTTPLFADPGGNDPPPTTPPGNGGGSQAVAVGGAASGTTAGTVTALLVYLGL